MPLRRTAVAVLLCATAACGEDSAESSASASAATPDAAPGDAATNASIVRAGRWVGEAANGFKGDSILFTVSGDGRTVSDVEFRGHWRCEGYTKRVDVGHVPGAFTVAADGAFSEARREPYLLWTVDGKFTGADAASGTLRIEYDTECDTHELEWTAAPAS
ncbi:MAG TPA: hypothetical protein VFQ45_17255 [Longimicrobium sp.]|nr:hypothetical protein [Longimicrobium sp.]